MATYIQKGNRIDYQNEGETPILSGDVVAFGTTRIGVAEALILPGEMGSVALTGVFEMPADNSQEMAVGAQVYWVTAQKKVSTTQEGNVPAGMVVTKKSSSGTTALVRLG